MEIAIIAGLFAKGDVDIDTCHAAKVSAIMSYGKIYVDKEADKCKLKIIKTLRNKRENKFNYNSKQKKAAYV